MPQDMPKDDALKKYAPVVLRAGLTALFLWFGASQVTAPSNWISWVPVSVPTLTHLDARTIVLLNGGFEVIGGVLLLLGVYVRWVALVMAIHLFVIAYEVGYNDIGVRDFCLGICTVALSMFDDDQWAVLPRDFQERYKALS